MIFCFCVNVTTSLQASFQLIPKGYHIFIGSDLIFNEPSDLILNYHKQQVKGIEGLVAKSVPGLIEEQVLIIDSMGNSLKGTIDVEAGIAGSQLELEHSTGEKIQKQVLALLEPVFGIGKVSVGVRVKLDFDKQTTESIRYEPVGEGDAGIPISSSVQNETAKNKGESGNVGLDSNGGAPQYAGADGSNGQYQKTNEIINYEVNQTRSKVQKAEGEIKEISISVLLDDKDLQEGADQKVKDIVAGAIGAAKDNVMVQTIPFNGSRSINEIFNDVQQTNEQIKKQVFLRNAIIYGLLGMLLFLILILAIISLKKKKKFDNKNVIPDSQNYFSATLEEDVGTTFKKSAKREFIEKKIEKNPELVAQLVRNWLNDEMR